MSGRMRRAGRSGAGRPGAGPGAIPAGWAEFWHAPGPNAASTAPSGTGGSAHAARAACNARAAVIREARLWIGTPYRHQASRLGAGCDCLGLVRGIWRALYGAEPEALPPYTPDWAEVAGEETLRDAAMRHLVEIDREAARPGDVLLFRPELDGPAKHCAILSKPDRIIHAYWRRSVAETALSGWWQRRLVAAFAFPPLPNPAETSEDPWRNW